MSKQPPAAMTVVDYDPVPVSAIKPWQEDCDNSDTDSEPAPDSPFPYNRSVNSKISLFFGSSYNVECDAVVNLLESSAARAVRKLAGPELEMELAILSSETNPYRKTGCRTGTILITPAYKVASAQYLIHTVGPKYEERYRVAAENVLHGCYRNCLQAVAEHGLRTVAFAPVHNFERKQYPPKLAVPIVLRTVRRFLDQWGHLIDRVVLCAVMQHDIDAYESLLPLYFPRSRTEQARAVQRLPDDVGNHIGETVINERSITIASRIDGEAEEAPRRAGNKWGADAGRLRGGMRPTATRFEESHARYEEPDADGTLFTTTVPAVAEFCSVQPPPHERRIERIRSVDRCADEYNRFLRRALQEPLTPYVESGSIVRAPVKDSKRRSVLVIFGSELPHAASSDDPGLLMYFVRTCDPILSGDISVVCFAYGVSNEPSIASMRSARAFLPATYSQRVKQVVFVGANWKTRLSLLAVFGRKPAVAVRHIPNVTHLEGETGVPLSALPPLPPVVYDTEVKAGASKSVAWRVP